jgi:hypothetical protein
MISTEDVIAECNDAIALNGSGATLEVSAQHLKTVLQYAARYNWLRTNGQCHSKQSSGALINDPNPLRRIVAFRYWCSPDQADRAIDEIIAKEGLE